MVDIVTPEKRSQMMAGIRGKDTKPEVLVRKALFARGWRYRLHDKRLLSKPDLVLSRLPTVWSNNKPYKKTRNETRLPVETPLGNVKLMQ